MKKILSLGLLLIFQIAIASSLMTCPSVSMIQQGKFGDWLPLYVDNEELASEHDTQLFQKHVRQFQTARWSSSYLEHGHCFYQGGDPILSKIVLAKDAWQPETSAHWSWVKPRSLAECNSKYVIECKFIE